MSQLPTKPTMTYQPAQVPFPELPRLECVAPPRALPGIVTYLFSDSAQPVALPLPAGRPHPRLGAVFSPLVDLLLQVLRTESFDFIVHATGLWGRGH